MKPRIPQGGFVIAAGLNSDLDVAAQGLLETGAKINLAREQGILLGAWEEYDGQGLWVQGDHGAAFDLDLTNATELSRSVGLDGADGTEHGRLLWLLYRQYGLDFVDQLRGAFAFALWDGANQEIIVVTDPYGIRPVVYLRNSKSLAAASRIRHLLHFPFARKEIDPEAIYHYLFFHAICSPLTIYKDVRKLEPGKGIQFKEGRFKTFVHYDIQYKTDNGKRTGYWKKAIPAALENAVAKYVPLSSYEKTGCFLSGGTDSSSLAGYYTKLTGRPAQTFSIAFDNEAYNEVEYARIAAKHFGLKAHEYWVTPEDVLSFLEIYPGLYDEPFGNSSAVPVYYCAKKAKDEGVEVLLGGDGGDEIFGGNQRYSTNLVFERYFAIPELVRKHALEPMLGILPDAGIFFKARRYIRRAKIPNPERFFSYNLLADSERNGILQPDFLSGLDPECFMNLMRNHFRRIAPAHVTDSLLYLDMKITITDNDLRKVNQMGEVCGLRTRFPFLTRELVDFAACIPPSLKATPAKTRVMFKEALRGFLPHEIIAKKKHGMGVPVGMWIKNHQPLSDLVHDMLLQENASIRHYIKPTFLEHIWRQMQSSSTPYYGDNLWVFLILEIWLSLHRQLADPVA
jgi:asparagine synthase (glutamine-hydrolysing)